MTKSQIAAHIAEKAEISKKQAAAVMEAQAELAYKQAKSSFVIPGIGKLVVDAIFDRDYPMIQGFVLFMGTVFLLVNLLVDLGYGLIDPRIRLASR